MNKGLTMKTGQTHVHKYLKKLMGYIEEGRIDPSSIISHKTAKLDDGPELYKTFRDKQDGCVKVVMFPHGENSTQRSTPARHEEPLSKQQENIEKRRV